MNERLTFESGVYSMFTMSLIIILSSITGLKSQSQLSPIISNSVPTVDESGDLTQEMKLTLSQSLDGVRIVALGEASHEDGLTFEHKLKVVKYLHEKLGYNVLAFEFGFYGNWLANKKLESGESAEIACKYAGWAKSIYGKPIYKYLEETYKTEKPLQYAGFDGEKVPLGVSILSSFINETTEKYHWKISKDDSLLIDSVIQGVYDRLGNEVWKSISRTAKKNARAILNTRKSQLYEMLNQNEDNQAVLLDYYVYTSILMDEKAESAASFHNIVRDKNMYERIVWLSDSIYPNEKIILWGASGHFARNMVSIDRDLPEGSYGFYPYYQTGDWLNAKYGEAFYHIAFTSGSGETGLYLPEQHKYKKYEEIRPIEAYQYECFERAALEANQNNLFTDLRSLENDSLASKPFIAHPFGYRKDYCNWSGVIDAFYFINEMKPDQLIE